MANKCSLDVNDVFEELIEENLRLNREMLFANKCLKVLIAMRNLLIEILTEDKGREVKDDRNYLILFPKDVSKFFTLDDEYCLLVRGRQLTDPAVDKEDTQRDIEKASEEDNNAVLTPETSFRGQNQSRREPEEWNEVRKSDNIAKEVSEEETNDDLEDVSGNASNDLSEDISEDASEDHSREEITEDSGQSSKDSSNDCETCRDCKECRECLTSSSTEECSSNGMSVGEEELDHSSREESNRRVTRMSVKKMSKTWESSASETSEGNTDSDSDSDTTKELETKSAVNTKSADFRVRQKASSEETLFTCDAEECGKVFKSEVYFHHHKKMHIKMDSFKKESQSQRKKVKRLFVCHYQGCLKLFKTRQGVRCHQGKVHKKWFMNQL